MSKKDEIVRALQFGNLKYKCVCYVLEKIGYSNHTLHKLEVRNRVLRYLEKKYKYFLASIEYEKTEQKEGANNVWICWFQGMEVAPPLVKKCYESVQFWMKDREIHLITEENLFDYIELPDYIIKKWKNGLISYTLLSDFVRLELLIKYGGIWVDATVLMTGPLPKFIRDSEFFMYSTSEEDEAKIGESWFIKANKENRILLVTRDILCEYWRKETKIRDYFIMFLCMKLAKDKYPEDCMRMWYIPNSIPLLLEKQLVKEFNEDYWNVITNLTTIHKLTYKYSVVEGNNTFVDKLLNIDY